MEKLADLGNELPCLSRGTKNCRIVEHLRGISTIQKSVFKILAQPFQHVETATKPLGVVEHGLASLLHQPGLLIRIYPRTASLIVNRWSTVFKPACDCIGQIKGRAGR